MPEGRWRLVLTDPELGREFEYEQDMIIFGDEYEQSSIWEGGEELASSFYR